MNSSWASYRPAILFAALAAGAAAVLAFAVASGTDQQATAGSSSQAASTLEQHFSAFRRAASRDDQITGPAAANADRQGVNEEKARHVHRGAPGPTIVAIPGRERVCTQTREQGSAATTVVCVDVDQAANDGVFSVSRAAPADTSGVSPETATVTALIPDGVNEVMFRLPDGTTKSADVIDNAVSATLGRPPLEAKFRDADGVQHTVPFGQAASNISAQG